MHAWTSHGTTTLQHKNKPRQTKGSTAVMSWHGTAVHAARPGGWWPPATTPDVPRPCGAAHAWPGVGGRRCRPTWPSRRPPLVPPPPHHHHHSNNPAAAHVCTTRAWSAGRQGEGHAGEGAGAGRGGGGGGPVSLVAVQQVGLLAGLMTRQSSVDLHSPAWGHVPPHLALSLSAPTHRNQWCERPPPWGAPAPHACVQAGALAGWLGATTACLQLQRSPEPRASPCIEP